MLQAVTSILRGEMSEEKGGPKISERTKAAELMGRRYGLFERQAEDGGEARRKAAAKVRSAFALLREAHEPAENA